MAIKSAIGQFVFDQALGSRGLRSRMFLRLRGVLSHYLGFDPVVATTLNNRRIFINLSHELPFYRKSFPFYSANLQRLAQFVRSQFGTLHMIDVGANVGDSFAMVGQEPDDSFLFIEGDSHYFELLSCNTPHDESVVRVKTFLQDKCETRVGHFVRAGGTTGIIGTDRRMADKNDAIQYQTLDDVVGKHPEFRACNLLKIDTDGFDCRVLRGGGGVITKDRPALLFEYHPRLHMLAGDKNYHGIFSELAKWGYSSFSFYDNVGFLVANSSIANPDLISDLTRYALHRGTYFDVVCFPDARKPMRDEFLSKEKMFYDGWYDKGT